jgi:hypothetical protein
VCLPVCPFVCLLICQFVCRFACLPAYHTSTNFQLFLQLDTLTLCCRQWITLLPQVLSGNRR